MKIKQHLESRYVNTDLHVAWLDLVEEVATFPLWNLSGQLLGTLRYNPKGDKKLNNDAWKGKYCTSNHYNHVAVWGMESWYLSNVLFVTEGMFDAARLTNRGYSAVAIMSSNASPSTNKWLDLVSRFRPVVVVLDNDAAGKKSNFVGNLYTTTVDKDLGDSPEYVVSNLLYEYGKL